MNPDGGRSVGQVAPWGWALGLAAVATALWAGLGSVGGLPWDDGSLKRVRQAGGLRVGYSVEAPYALVASDGSVTGAFPEAMRHLVRQQQLGTITWVQMPLDNLIPALLERRIDVAAAGLFITPQRGQLVRFSQPLVTVRPGWLTPPGNPLHLGSYDDAARRPDLTVAVLQGSQEQARLQALGMVPARLLAVPDALSGQALVRAGRVDALALSLPTVNRIAATTPGGLTALPAGMAADVQAAALALHPDDLALARELDTALAALRQQPAYLATLQGFGFGPESLPAQGGTRP